MQELSIAEVYTHMPLFHPGFKEQQIPGFDLLAGNFHAGIDQLLGRSR